MNKKSKNGKKEKGNQKKQKKEKRAKQKNCKETTPTRSPSKSGAPPDINNLPLPERRKLELSACKNLFLASLIGFIVYIVTTATNLVQYKIIAFLTTVSFYTSLICIFSGYIFTYALLNQEVK